MEQTRRSEGFGDVFCQFSEALNAKMEQNQRTDSPRRIKQFVCLSVFISTHEVMLSERFGDVFSLFQRMK